MTKAPVRTPWFLRSRGTLLTTLLVTLATPLCALAFVASRIAGERLEADAIARNDAEADLAASALNGHFGWTLRYAESFALRPAVVEAVARRDAAALHFHLQQLLEVGGIFDRAIVCDVAGVEWADWPHDTTVIGRDFSHRDWYTGVRSAGRPYVSIAYRRAAEPRVLVVAAAVPILGGTGDAASYLVVQQPLERIAESLRRASEPGIGSIHVVDRNRRLLPPRADAAADPTDVSAHELLRAWSSAPHRVHRGPDLLTGEEGFYSLRGLPAYGWIVSVGRSVDSIRAPIGALRAGILTATGVVYGLMVALGFAWLEALRRRQQAILRLQEATARQNAELETLDRKRHASQSESQELARELELRNAELRAINQELEAFSYSVSHDLRAPLRAIGGFSQAIEEDFASTLPEEVRSHLERIRAAAGRMGALIDDLLDLARLSRVEVQATRVDLSSMASEVVTELRRADPDRRVEVALDPDVVVWGDAKLLRIALSNLIGNAWKFSVSRDPAHVTFGATRAQNRGGFFVRDDGVGFDPGCAGRLFAPFQRLHRPEDYPGTGIGLAIVKGVVVRHGGTVVADAAVGSGATFTVLLPDPPSAPA